MKYEVLYSAVLSAAPTVLIGYVLEHRLSSKYRQGRRDLMGAILGLTSIIACSLSAMLSLLAIGFGTGGDSQNYAALVTATLFFGICALLGLLLGSVVGADLVDSSAP